jgi:hypothetical protein
LDVHRNVWENLGIETKGAVLDIHCGCRTVVTYVATVWWTRIKFKTSKVELSKLQRMACLGITGAMKTAPMAPTEVLIGLLPIGLAAGG